MTPWMCWACPTVAPSPNSWHARHRHASGGWYSPRPLRAWAASRDDPACCGIWPHPAAVLVPAYARRVAPKIYGGRTRQNLERLLTYPAARLEHPPPLYGYLAQLYAGAGWTSLPWLHRIPHPTLVLAGDDDPIIPVANGRILATRIPGARLAVIDGGHLFLLDQLEEASAHLLPFLTPEGGQP